jgi:hypothetical protein
MGLVSMDSLESSDGLIDDEGTLLGVINVVDAVVIVLVLATLAAGTGLVLTGGAISAGPETGTTYATVDLGTQPDYIVSALEEGDTYSPTSGSNLTITDIYLAPQGERTRVLLRTELRGPVDNGTVEYAGAPPRLGRNVSITPDTYNTTGQISDVGSASALDTDATTVVLQDTMSPTDAYEITAGDDISIAGHRVATVDDVIVYPRSDPNVRTVLVETTLATYSSQGTHRFGDTKLQDGNRVRLQTANYTVDGRIDRVGSGLERDTRSNRTVTLELTSVRENIATVLRPGLTETVGSDTTAYVTDVDTEPTPIVTTAEDGSVVVADHPTLRDVTLTTELQVSETDVGIQFKQERLQYGSTVALDLGTVTVEATVVDIGQ